MALLIIMKAHHSGQHSRKRYNIYYLPSAIWDKLFNQDELNKTLKKGNEYILFVDDEQEITYMGKKMLENLGYKVTIKSDSLSALEEFKSDPMKYSLLVTDQTMPKMFGTELAARMKEIRPGLKVIIITGYIDKLSEELITKNWNFRDYYETYSLKRFQ